MNVFDGRRRTLDGNVDDSRVHDFLSLLFSFTHDAPSEFLAQFSFFAEESTLVLMLTPSFYNRLTKTVVWLDILFFYTATVCTQVSEIAYVILEMELIELQPSVLMTDCPLVSKTDGVFHVADR